MSKHSYKDFVKEKAVEPIVDSTPVEEIEAPVIEETVEDVAEEVVEQEAEPTVVKEELKTVEGVIDGVNTALNIRRKPEVKPNNQIGIAGKGTKVIIVDPDHPVKNNGEEWYKVLFNKEPGYAMKKYIVIK